MDCLKYSQICNISPAQVTMDRLKRLTENASNVQGFLVFHSFGVKLCILNVFPCLMVVT